jgi:hypothetical protein
MGVSAEEYFENFKMWVGCLPVSSKKWQLLLLLLYQSIIPAYRNLQFFNFRSSIAPTFVLCAITRPHPPPFQANFIFLIWHCQLSTKTALIRLLFAPRSSCCWLAGWL